MSRHIARTSPDPSNLNPGDPEIYCIALINDATNARISGCWFGLDPNGTTVAGGRSAVAAFKDKSGASASGLIFGTDGDGQNDPAEFNISIGMGPQKIARITKTGRKEKRLVHPKGGYVKAFKVLFALRSVRLNCSFSVHKSRLP